MAAMLCQIGLVTIPPVVLQKARSGLGLTAQRKDMLARVPETGATLLAKCSPSGRGLQSFFYQKKNFDGSGFPIGQSHRGGYPHRIPHPQGALRPRPTRSPRHSQVQSAGANAELPWVIMIPAFWIRPLPCFDIYLSKTTRQTAYQAIRAKELEIGQIYPGQH